MKKNQQTPRIEHIGDRLTLVGTIHVAPESVELVRGLIREIRPRIVGLELDEARLVALLGEQGQLSGSTKTRSARRGWPGLSAFLMAFLERFAGEIMGSAPGREMLVAVETAQEVGAQVALVDLPIGMTMSAMSQLPLTEKARLGIDLAAGLLFLPFGRGAIENLGESVEDQLRLFRDRYPSLSRILIDMREDHMVEMIEKIMSDSTGDVVVVVGLGHLRSLTRALEIRVRNNPTRHSDDAGQSSTVVWTINT